jgi:hypothetical protein
LLRKMEEDGRLKRKEDGRLLRRMEEDGGK